MTFDIIEISDEELGMLDTVQLKLLRTAQQKKNELEHKLEEQIREVRLLARANGINAGYITQKSVEELEAECAYQVEIIREQLVFSMSLREPTSDGETGGSDVSFENGYLVDYSLSYLERYIAVRDYYLAIEDPDERVSLFGRDSVARNYLSSYYDALFDYFVTLTTYD